MKRRYVIAYDIADDRRRGRVFRLLSDAGDHVQKSVFLCELNGARRVRLEARLREVVRRESDQILFVDFGNAELPLDNNHGFSYIGKPYRPPGRLIIV